MWRGTFCQCAKAPFATSRENGWPRANETSSSNARPAMKFVTCESRMSNVVIRKREAQRRLFPWKQSEFHRERDRAKHARSFLLLTNDKQRGSGGMFTHLSVVLFTNSPFQRPHVNSRAVTAKKRRFMARRTPTGPKKYAKISISPANRADKIFRSLARASSSRMSITSAIYKGSRVHDAFQN